MLAFLEETKSRRVIQLDSLIGTVRQHAMFYVLYSGGGSIVVEPTTLATALARGSERCLLGEIKLPFGRAVPDAGIQALVVLPFATSGRRREIKTVCRFSKWADLLSGCGSWRLRFLAEAAAMVGAGQEARSGITHTLTQQRPSGAFEVLSRSTTRRHGIVALGLLSVTRC